MQNLVEKILRMKIYNSMYWKEHCFALTAESLVDKAVELKYVGGTFGGQVCAVGDKPITGGRTAQGAINPTVCFPTP